MLWANGYFETGTNEFMNPIRARITRCDMAKKHEKVQAGSGDVFTDLGFADAG